jgi:serine/threonine-protein kinase
MSQLLLESGGDRGKRFPLSQEVWIGRSSDCRICVPDGRLSRRHARIFRRDGRFWLEDAESLNGTWLNGRRVQSAALDHGDRIWAGGVFFRFVGVRQEVLLGRKLGGYLVEGVLGEGGMGTVYRAKQVSLDREVALKVLHGRFLKNESYVARFLQEAKAAARLNHPGLIQVYDAAREGEHLFFVMELVRGENLMQRLQRERSLAVDAVLGWVVQAAEALGYAHRMGVIHRDVKPENLLLDPEGRIRIGDLGIAKMAEAEEEPGRSEEGPPRVLGTPGYLAPESIDPKKIGPQADIYSLGATAYHLLTGDFPFGKKRPSEIVRAQIATDPLPADLRRSDLPRPVSALVERMMQRDLASRFSSMDEAVREVRALQAERPSQDHPVSPRRDSSRSVALWTAVVLLAGVLGWCYRWMDGRPPVGTGGGPSARTRLEDRQVKEALLEAERLRNAGTLEEALGRYEAILREHPDSRFIRRVPAVIGDIRRELSQRREAEAEEAFGRCLRRVETTADLEERITLWLDLGQAYAGTAAGGRALFESRRLEHEREQRVRMEEDRIRKERRDRFLLGMPQVKELIHRLDFSGARRLLDRLNEEGGESWMAAEAASLLGDLDRAEGDYVDRRLSVARSYVESGRYGEAWRLLGELAASVEGGGQADRVSDERGTLDRRMEGEVERARQEAFRQLEGHRYAQARDALAEPLRRLEGTSCAEGLKPLYRQLVLLAELRETVMGHMREGSKPAFMLWWREGRGGHVKELGEDQIWVDEGGGVVSGKRWDQLEPRPLYDLYRHYLDERKNRSHLLLYVFCRLYGMKDKAGRHEDRARRAWQEEFGEAME